MVADESPARWTKIQLTTYPRRPRVLLGVMFVCVSYFYVSTLKSLSTNGPISSGFYNHSASPKQAWPALAYDNVVNMPIWPDYVHRSPKGVPVTIIMSVFNQEGTIQQTLEALLDKTEGPFELIAIFDGCTDESPQIYESVIAKWTRTNTLRKTWKANKGMVNFRSFHLDTSQFETKSNNIGFRNAMYDYAIVVQDDMMMVQPGWDRHLLRPALGFSDVLGVTARCAHNMKWLDHAVGFTELTGNCGAHHFDVEMSNVFTIRDSCNRGPLLLDLAKLRELDFLDEEFYPQEMDEHDLCLRAFQQFGWVCGVLPVSVHSTQTTHRWDQVKPDVLKTAYPKNEKLFVHRHALYLRENLRHDQERYINLTDTETD